VHKEEDEGERVYEKEINYKINSVYRVQLLL